MAIRSSPGVRGAPCSKYRGSPRPKKKDQPDIKMVSHKQTVQHSVRAQKLDERQLSKFFKGLDDLKSKRLLQIDKEMAEQEQILEKLQLEMDIAHEQRLTRRAGTTKDAEREANADISALLPEHLKRGLRPSVRRGSTNFDLYAFMMRRESDPSVTSYDVDGKVTSKPKNTRKQSRRSPRPASNNDDHAKPAANSARDDLNETTPRVASPSKSVPTRPSSSSASIGSIALSVSIGSLPPSTPVFGLHDDDALSPTSLKRNFPRGSDWSDEVSAKNVNKEQSARARQRTLASKQPQMSRGVVERETKAKTLPLSQVKGKNTFNPSVGSRRGQTKPKAPLLRLKKEVSFHLDTAEDEDDMDGSGVAIGAGIMQKNNLLQVVSSHSSSPDPTPECTEPDCIFHNKSYRRSSLPTDEDYTIDDYYQKVRGRPTVSPIFMPAGTPRSWSRRGVVRPPSPNLSDFLREFDDTKPPTSVETSKGSLAESDSFLTVRRPLKGSNRERMLKDKEENVRTTFNLMRQKMADQKPAEFNQNYGTPTPNWKILNPLKMRHKINQSNPLHVRWGL